MSITKNMFVQLDDDGNPIEEVKKKTATKKKPAEKKEESLLHDSGHNIVVFLSGGKLGYPAVFEYRDLLVKDEEVLSTATDTTYSRTINSVLKSVMNDPEWYEKMTVHDRDYALMWIWAQNYGSTKTLTVTCSNRSCGAENTHVVDLTNLPVTKLNEKIKVPLNMTLKNGVEIEVNLPTVADELFVEEWLKNHPNDKYQTVMTARLISFGMEPRFEEKMKWISENVLASEYGKIKKYHELAFYGVNGMIEHKCKHCKEVTYGEIPFSTSDVLWPTVHADIEEFL